ncbi:MAG: LapA family protein [Ferrimicrobium sp.]
MEQEGDAIEPNVDRLPDDQARESDASTPQVADTEPASEGKQRHLVERPHSTRTSRVWIGSFFGLVVLIAILVFILQNLVSIAIHFPGSTIRMPVGVAILFGVILGGLFVFLLGLARVLQLRRSMGRNRKVS